MKEKILVIDDEKSIRLTTEAFLLKEGYTIFVAEGYDEAMEIIDIEYPDLITADILLGGRTGIDVLKEVNKKMINCPVILFTGYPNTETAVEAVRLGAYDYLIKPFKKDELIRTIKKALRFRSVIEEKNRYQRNLEAIFKSMTDALITVDKELKILEINNSAVNVCGLSRRNVLGASLNEVCGVKCIEALNKTLKNREPVEVKRFECGNKTLSLKTFPLIDKKEFAGAVMIVKDESPIVKLEKKIKDTTYFNIVGKNKKMSELYAMIDNLSEIDTTVLITGESGTGKELAAEAIHNAGNRSRMPFVKVNCAALSENLLESELFGHVKGAFTGALNNKTGRFQMADGGTILLDEIGDISLPLQVKLLRVLENKEIERVGESRSIKIDVRLITATNQNLKKKIMDGSFREDLYYRLKVVEITMPPLRERIDDIPVLVSYFIKKYNQKFNMDIIDISNEVHEIFMNYSWPGNVRELEHTMEHSFIICKDSTITAENLPKEMTNRDNTPYLPEDGNDEYKTLLRTLVQCRWNKTKAANILGVTRRTLYNRIKKHNIPIE